MKKTQSRKLILQRETLRAELELVRGGLPEGGEEQFKDPQPLSAGPSWCGC